MLNLVFMLLFEAGRLYFVLYNASYFNENLLSVFYQTAINGLRLDLSASAYCMVPFILLGLFSPLLNDVWQKRLSVAFILIEMVLILLITVADPELFRQWGSKFNNQVLVYVTHPREMALSSGSADFVRTGLFLAVFLPLMYLHFKLAVMIFNIQVSDRKTASVLSFMYAGLGFVMLRGGTGVTTISQSSAIFTSDRAINAAAINSTWNAIYYLVNDSKSLYGNHFMVTDSQTARAAFEAQTRPDGSMFQLTDVEKPNILVVMLESFTASGSRFFYGKNDCTPGLDRIAADNLSFTSCYASGDRTEKGLVCVNSGYPAQPLSSVAIFPDKVAKLPGLGKDLKQLGYHNLFLYGGDADFASMKSYLHMQEFGLLIDKNQFRPQDINSKWGAHDDKLYAKALEMIDAGKAPFYALMLTLSSHEPYTVPISSPDLPKDSWYPFKNALRYADQCLEAFIAACSKTDWYNNTLIVLVADHGHDIGLADVHYFGPEKYHIPLVVTGGALKPSLKGKRVAAPVSQTVIPALILTSLGKQADAYRWQSGFADSTAFAQYHYNNGFGRITSRAWGVHDNTGNRFHFEGQAKDSAALRSAGSLFQQVLVEDFLSK